MDAKEIKLNVAERFVRANLQHYNEKKYWNRRQKVVSAKMGGGICWVKYSMHIVSYTLNDVMHLIMQAWEPIWGMAPNLEHLLSYRMAYTGL